MTTYTINQEFNGIEITFDCKPAETIRNALKKNGFRWHRQKALWYAKNTPQRLKVAEEIAEGKAPATTEKATTTKAAKKENKFGVQVGDIFTASWGYEQTNVDFFQVVELVGSSSVRVREVHPAMINESPTCSMAADRTYSITKDMQSYPEHSIFISDQERGDLKRLKSWAADGVSNPEIKIRDYISASLVQGDKLTTYESWYY